MFAGSVSLVRTVPSSYQSRYFAIHVTPCCLGVLQTRCVSGISDHGISLLDAWLVRLRSRTEDGHHEHWVRSQTARASIPSRSTLAGTEGTRNVAFILSTRRSRVLRRSLWGCPSPTPKSGYVTGPPPTHPDFVLSDRLAGMPESCIPVHRRNSDPRVLPSLISIPGVFFAKSAT